MLRVLRVLRVLRDVSDVDLSTNFFGVHGRRHPLGNVAEEQLASRRIFRVDAPKFSSRGNVA